MSAQLLYLPASICISGENEMGADPIQSVDVIQLACANNASLKARGDVVTIVGELFPSHTGYHVTRVMLQCR